MLRKSLIILLIVLLGVIFVSCRNVQNQEEILHNGDGGEELSKSREESEIEEQNLKVLALGNINIRSSPDTSGNNIVGLLKKNNTLDYIESYNDSWNVVDYKGSKAYITASFKYSKIIDADAEETDENNVDIIESVIGAGMAVLGTPYEYGSTRLLNQYGEVNPYFTGNTFDCSAFVQYAFYTGGGIKLKGDSRSQSRDGELIALDDIQRGDLVFMTSTARQYNVGIEKIGHVAIYIGDNKLLHTYGTGGVRITDFNSFWRGRTLLVRRMI
ncbi:MAG: C40 family peptidase [Christensenellales bacterium]|jgi:cell wall-associated NlpC family hydrolase